MTQPGSGWLGFSAIGGKDREYGSALIVAGETGCQVAALAGFENTQSCVNDLAAEIPGDFHGVCPSIFIDFFLIVRLEGLYLEVTSKIFLDKARTRSKYLPVYILEAYILAEPHDSISS